MCRLLPGRAAYRATIKPETNAGAMFLKRALSRRLIPWPGACTDGMFRRVERSPLGPLRRFAKREAGPHLTNLFSSTSYTTAREKKPMASVVGRQVRDAEARSILARRRGGGDCNH